MRPLFFLLDRFEDGCHVRPARPLDCCRSAWLVRARTSELGGGARARRLRARVETVLADCEAGNATHLSVDGGERFPLRKRAGRLTPPARRSSDGSRTRRTVPQMSPAEFSRVL